MILYCIVTSAINCLASLVLALMVYWKKPRSRANLAFCWFAVTAVLWSGFYFAWQVAENADTALQYTRVLSAGAILIPIAYFHFALRLLGEEHRLSLRLGYVLSALFAGFSLVTPLVVAGVEPRLGFPFWPVPGPLYSAYLVFFAFYLIATLRMFVRGYRAADGLRRNQLRLVTLGTAAGFVGGATNFLLWYGIPIPPVGNGLVAVYVVAVGYAIIRFRLMDYDLLAVRVVAYAALVALFALVPPLILRGFSALLLITPDQAAYVPVFFASFLTLGVFVWTLSGLRRRMDSFLEERVLGNRLPNREMLRRLAARLSSAQGEAELFRDAVAGIGEALDAVDIKLYTRTEFEADYHCRTTTAAHFPESSPLARMLLETRRSVLIDEQAHGPAEEQRDFFRELRSRQGLELAVPVFGDSFFYGFLTLGPRRGHALYTDADVSLLEAIGLQIGLNLRARQLERRTSQTEKLISLGTLAAGLAHELRNPLTSIQTFSALLKERHPDPEALHEFSHVVQRDVQRIASIVENVSAFAESNKVEMAPVSLAEVLRAVGEIVRSELQRTGVRLVLPTGDSPRSVTGNHSQLLQVFINLVQNALQAMEGRSGSCIPIGFEERRSEDVEPMLCVTVADNGPGIDAAVLPYIFEPFTTTKATGERRGKHGMGLGLAIVKRIIQYHHGEIHVESQPGHGTTFKVYLPLLS